MKKIKAAHSGLDRIVCVNGNGTQSFFYQPHGASTREWLFDDDFHGSLFTFFRDKGCRAGKKSFSITLDQLYRFRAYGNERLTRSLERIPPMVNYVLAERGDRAPQPARTKRRERVRYDPAEAYAAYLAQCEREAALARECEELRERESLVLVFPCPTTPAEPVTLCGAERGA